MEKAWYIYVLALLAGSVAGAINTLAGSGSLITLPVLVFLGLPPTVANGTNRVGVLLQNVIGMATLHRGGKLPLQGSGWYVLPTLVGAGAGAYVASQVDDRAMNWVIGAVMLLMLGVAFLNPKKWLEDDSKLPEKPGVLLILAFVGVGFYGGFIQAGVGILLLVALVVGAGYGPVSANGVKLFLTLLFTFVALPIFAYMGQVDWALGGLMAIGQGAGAWAAAKFAVESEDAGLWIRRVLVVVVLVSVTKLFGLW